MDKSEIKIQESKEGVEAVLAFCLGVISGGTSNIYYDYKSSKRFIRIEKELEYLQTRQVEIADNLDPLNHIHISEMIKKIMYTPVSIDERIKDNFLDIVLYEDYDERIIYEFLQCDALEYNDLLDIANNILVKEGAYILPQEYITEYKRNLFFNNGYISGAGMSSKFGDNQRTYQHYILTEKGYKFFSLF